jgi:hypothetical protein
MKANAKSPQAGRALRERVSKILPLLNSDHAGERQAAAEALRGLDLLGVSAVLQATLGLEFFPAPRHWKRTLRAS